MRSAALFPKKKVIFCLCDIDFGGTSEKKAFSLLGGQAKPGFSVWGGQRSPELTFLSFYFINSESLPVFSHPEELVFSFWRQQGQKIALSMNTFFLGSRQVRNQGFFWHIGFFGGVRQRVSRTTSIIYMRDGLTKWFLEGTEEDVVRRIFERRFFSNTKPS